MKMTFSRPLLCLLLLNSSVAFSAIPYNENELNIIKQHLFQNITTDQHVVIKQERNGKTYSIPGAVLASPSYQAATFTQDYQFHWVRDAAIAVNEIVTEYALASVEEKRALKPYLLNYIEFERRAQSQVSHPGEETLGQPKFNIDATIFEGEWGRPQNDGAALRAIVLSRIANLFIDEGDEQWVRDHLVEMIQKDLDYIMSHWTQSSFDLWEEVNDTDHFFTKMVQRKSSVDGSMLLSRLGDHWRVDGYRHVVADLSVSLGKHWNSSRGFFTETISQQTYKGGGLDSSIILGVLYGSLENPNDSFAVNNDRVMSSVYFIRNAFASLYKVNLNNPALPPLIGRYPNDIYDGDQFVYGNPWPLLTNALANYYYLLAHVYEKAQSISVTEHNLLFFKQIKSDLVMHAGIVSRQSNPEQFHAIIKALKHEGDGLLENAKNYATTYADGSNLHFAEQIDRASGASVSAKDLSWGYATILTAMRARESR